MEREFHHSVVDFSGREGRFFQAPSGDKEAIYIMSDGHDSCNSMTRQVLRKGK